MALRSGVGQAFYASLISVLSTNTSSAPATDFLELRPGGESPKSCIAPLMKEVVRGKNSHHLFLFFPVEYVDMSGKYECNPRGLYPNPKELSGLILQRVLACDEAPVFEIPQDPMERRRYFTSLLEESFSWKNSYEQYSLSGAALIYVFNAVGPEESLGVIVDWSARNRESIQSGDVGRILDFFNSKGVNKCDWSPEAFQGSLSEIFSNISMHQVGDNEEYSLAFRDYDYELEMLMKGKSFLSESAKPLIVRRLNELLTDPASWRLPSFIESTFFHVDPSISIDLFVDLVLENRGDVSGGSVGRILEALNLSISREKNESGEKEWGVLDDQVKALFDTISIPGIIGDLRWTHDPVGSFHSILNRHPEYSRFACGFAKELFVVSYDAHGDIDSLLRVVEDGFSAEDASSLYTEFVRHREGMHDWPVILDSAISCILRRDLVEDEIIDFFGEFFDSVLIDIENTYEERELMRVADSLNSFIEKYPNIEEKVGELVVIVDGLRFNTLRSQIERVVPGTSLEKVRVIVSEKGIDGFFEVLEHFENISLAISLLPDGKKRVIIEELKELMIEAEDFDKVTYFVDGLLGLRRSVDIESLFKTLNFSLDDVDGIFTHEVISELLVLMANNSDKYSFQLASLVSYVPWKLLPDKVRSVFGDGLKIDNEMRLMSSHGNWFLCSMSESRMMRAMENKATVLVNDNFLVKFDGKMTALCLKNVRVGDLAFVSGAWYSPVGQKEREALKKAFDSGESRMILDGASWVLMRTSSGVGMRGTSAEFLDSASGYVENMPDEIPDEIEGMARKIYRKTHHERN